jgi:hypothetical protein
MPLSKKITCKGTLRQVLINVMDEDTVNHVVFST